MRAWTLIAVALAVAASGCLQLQVGTVPPASQPDEARASIAFAPSAPKPGQTVSFQGAVLSPAEGDKLLSATWSFGDGGTASGLKAQHAYKAAGAYVVKLVADTKLSGRLTASKEVVVATPGAAPKAGPAGGSGGGSAPSASPLDPPLLAVAVERNVARFSFSLAEAPDQVSWEFGDGATSAEAAPTHAYLSKGEFRVRLRVAVGSAIAENTTQVTITDALARPRVVVGVTDTGIDPYHDVYYRPAATAHPCTYVQGYSDCSIEALNLTVGPDGGSYGERLVADANEWAKVRPGGWYWIPRTNLVAVHCPDGGSTQGGRCILDDETDHGTGTTSSVLTEAPDALLVFNDGSDGSQLAGAPVPVDVESNSWGTVPLYGGLVNGPTGQRLCYDDADTPVAVKFRSAGNNGPVPNLGDCARNGFRAYSVSGGYPDGSHGEQSGSAPDFASYWCRPVAAAGTLSDWRDACGTSFAAPTAAGTAAATLLAVRRETDYTGGSTAAEVAPGLTHDAFVEALVWAATYDPQPRSGYPEGSVVGPVTSTTPWLWWGWGWLDRQVVPQALECAMGRACPDNKPAEAWAFNDVRRSFASDGSAG